MPRLLRIVLLSNSGDFGIRSSLKFCIACLSDRLTSGTEQALFHLATPNTRSSDMTTDFRTGEDRLLVSRMDFRLNHPLE